MSKNLTFLHLANFNSTNAGNGALIYGTERVLREDLGTEISFEKEPWDDYTFNLRTFDDGFIDRVNASDALLVGGAVAINARPYLKNTGMRLDLPYDMWRRISKPVIFYGISYRVWPCQRFYHFEKFRRIMEYILECPRMLFSVRNDGTKSWLESLLGYKAEKIREIPDPALYVPVEDILHPELDRNKVNVILSLNNEDEVYRYGGTPRKLFWKIFAPVVEEKKLLRAWRVLTFDRFVKKTKFLRNLASALDRISRRYDLNLILVPHYFDDLKIMGEFMSYCPLAMPHQRMTSGALSRASQARYFYNLYAKADISLSMRVHSMSPSIGLGVPTVVLSSQRRLEEFVRNIGMEDFCLSVFDEDLAEKLCQLFDRCVSESMEVKERLAAVKKVMRQRTLEFNRSVSQILQ